MPPTKPSVISTVLFTALTLATLTIAQRPGRGRGGDDWEDRVEQELEDRIERQLRAAELEDQIQTAHGVIGCLTFALLFPLGAILLRLIPGRLAVIVHAIVQVTALAFAIVTLGMGVWMAQGNEYIESYHAIIGLVVISAVLLQPITGVLHHRLFKRTGRRSALSYVHVWWGIAAITLGIINGGFGLELAGAPRRYGIVYAVFAALIWTVWMVISFASQCLSGFRKNKKRAPGSAADLAERERKPSHEARENNYA